MPTKEATVKVPDSKVVRNAEELPCKLNPVEWGAKAEELSQSLQAVTQVEQRKAAMMSQIGSDLKTAKARANKLASIVATHTEYREVTVETSYDYETGHVKRVRTDTGEVLEDREMTDSERQIELVTDADTFIEDARAVERELDDSAEEEDTDESD